MHKIYAERNFDREAHFSVQFSVDYEHRASIKLDRMAVINAVADLVPKVTAICLHQLL